MKVKITMKDPDGVCQSVIDSIVENMPGGLDEEGREVLYNTRKEMIMEVISKWIWASEYLTVEIDTEEETIEVVPSGHKRAQA